MKKLSNILVFILPLGVLGALAFFMGLAPMPDLGLLCIYALCFLFVPLLGVCAFSRALRGFLYGFSIFVFSCGIPASLILSGQIGATVLLAFGVLSVSLLEIHRALPLDTPDIAHLVLRGLPAARARRKLLLRDSYAFFFFYSGRLMALAGFWRLFITGNVTLLSLCSMALSVVCLGFLGFLLSGIFSTNLPRRPEYVPRKGRLVGILLLTLSLALIACYVYAGEAYTAPEPALAAALQTVQMILTPALIAIAVAFPLGMAMGYLLSLIGNRFFRTILGGLLRLPLPLGAGLLYLCLPSFPFCLSISISVPLLLWSAYTMLESRAALAPFRAFPPAGQKKALLWPLFHRIHFALLPRLAVCALLSSLLIGLPALDSLRTMPVETALVSASIFVVTISILYVLCFFVKEARHYE